MRPGVTYRFKAVDKGVLGGASAPPNFLETFKKKAVILY